MIMTNRLGTLVIDTRTVRPQPQGKGADGNCNCKLQVQSATATATWLAGWLVGQENIIYYYSKD